MIDNHLFEFLEKLAEASIRFFDYLCQSFQPLLKDFEEIEISLVRPDAGTLLAELAKTGDWIQTQIAAMRQRIAETNCR